MVTDIQRQVASQRASDPSYQRAVANAVKSGNTASLSRLATQMGTTSQNLISATSAGIISNKVTSATSAPSIQVQTGGNTMGAGSTYDKIDTMLGGMLPGGVPPTPAGVSTALKLAGITAGTAVVSGLAYGAYKAFKKDGTPKKKHRTMNYNNPKALSRSERRLKSYVKHARKHVSALGLTIKRKGAD